MPDGAVINVPVEGSRLGNGQEGLVVRFGAASRCVAFDTVNSRVDIEDAASRRDDNDARSSANELRYRTLFDAVSDAVLVYLIDDGRPGLFVEAITIAVDVLGYSLDEILRVRSDHIVAEGADTPGNL